MFEKGLIFKGQRIVNWCPKLGSVISDIEVIHEPIEQPEYRRFPNVEQEVPFGYIYDFAYPLADGEGEIVVATTRPETVFGDLAIAVHPNDPRYTHLKGKFVYHPITQRHIPIIFDDEVVDMDKGTGAVKITPAHSSKDYICAKRHGLGWLNIFKGNGTLNENCGDFAKMHRWQARVKVIEMMDQFNLLRRTRKNPTTIPICSRTGDIIEPILKPQWFLSTKLMCDKASEYVEDEIVNLFPETFKEEYLRWLKNPRPWCISRQLWWGHPIPVYQIFLKGEKTNKTFSDITHDSESDSQMLPKFVVARNIEEAQQKASIKYNVSQERILAVQETDVLDTWFSSALLPLSALGWPRKKINQIVNLFFMEMNL